MRFIMTGTTEITSISIFTTIWDKLPPETLQSKIRQLNGYHYYHAIKALFRQDGKAARDCQQRLMEQLTIHPSSSLYRMHNSPIEEQRHYAAEIVTMIKAATESSVGSYKLTGLAFLAKWQDIHLADELIVNTYTQLKHYPEWTNVLSMLMTEEQIQQLLPDIIAAALYPPSISNSNEYPQEAALNALKNLLPRLNTEQNEEVWSRVTQALTPGYGDIRRCADTVIPLLWLQFTQEQRQEKLLAILQNVQSTDVNERHIGIQSLEILLPTFNKEQCKELLPIIRHSLKNSDNVEADALLRSLPVLWQQLGAVQCEEFMPLIMQNIEQYWIQAIVPALKPLLNEQQREALLLALTKRMPSCSLGHLSTLLKCIMVLQPQLSQEQCTGTLSRIIHVLQHDDEYSKYKALTAFAILIPQLSQELRQEILPEVIQIFQAETIFSNLRRPKLEVLVALWPECSTVQRQELLATITQVLQGNYSWETQIRMIEYLPRLWPQLNQDQREELLPAIKQNAQENSSMIEYLLNIIPALWPQLSQPWREEFLTAIIGHLQVDDRDEVEASLETLHILWPQLSQEQHEKALPKVTQRLNEGFWWLLREDAYRLLRRKDGRNLAKHCTKSLCQPTLLT